MLDTLVTSLAMATDRTPFNKHAQSSTENENSLLDDNPEVREDGTPKIVTPSESSSNNPNRQTRSWALSVLRNNNIVSGLQSPVRVARTVSRWGRDSKDWIKKSASNLFGKVKEYVTSFRRDTSTPDEADPILLFPEPAEINRALEEIQIGDSESLHCGLGAAPDIPSIFPEVPSWASEVELPSLEAVYRPQGYRKRYRVTVDRLHLSTRPPTPSTLEAVFGTVEDSSDSSDSDD